MKTDTSKKIYQFIEKQTGVRAKEIIKYIGLNATGIFRHLKKLQDKGLIYKVGKPPKVFYYAKNKQNGIPASNQDIVKWAQDGQGVSVNKDDICARRDAFEARQEKLLSLVKTELGNENTTFLIVAAVGEIGNNSFDHNLGKWLDQPGVYFNINIAAREIALADRGQGVLGSLKKVKPDLANDQEALRVAFTEVVSGRYPEQRGNGLKFVKQVIKKNNLSLYFYSGNAVAVISDAGLEVKKQQALIPGTLAIIKF
jgi:DNA-binding HxlR family transcriptional regulator